VAVKYRQKGGEVSPRQLFLLLFLLLYLLPLVLFGMHSLHGAVWGAFFGLLVGLVGLSLLSVLFRWWEGKSEPEPIVQQVAPDTALIEEMEQKALEQGQEIYRLRGELDEVRAERESILAEYQQAINNQRARLEAKQERVAQLESKVNDLSFEIRTLLQVDEMEAAPLSGDRGPAHREVDQWVETLPPSSDPGVHTQYDAFVVLHRCLQTAHGLTGAGHFSGESSRLSELSLSNATIDLRRLFDKLKGESDAMVVAFSRSEGRLLFANAMTRALLGWSSERFVRDFAHLLRGGRREWDEATQTIQPGEEASLRLVLRDKEGSDQLIQCCMGMVARGAFKGCILAVLYRP